MTLAKLKPSSLYILTNSSYTFIGEDPVANPNTQGTFKASLSRIKAAISCATSIEASDEESKITIVKKISSTLNFYTHFC